MKKVTLLNIAFLFSASIFAQKTPGYLSISGGVAFIDDAKKVIGHISAGVSPNRVFGVGVGIGFVDIDNTYIPLTVDISYFGKPRNITPVVIGSAGYGVYKKANPYFTTKGGFTGSLRAGVSIPGKNNAKLLLTGGYSMYGFSGGKNIQTSGSSYKVQDNLKVFIVTVGVKI